MTILKITDSSFEIEVKEGITIVDFWAEWCGPCRALGPLLEELSKDFANKVKICKLNVDENQEVASKFGIRSIPTLIAFKDGQKADIRIGGGTKQDLSRWLTSLL